MVAAARHAVLTTEDLRHFGLDASAQRRRVNAGLLTRMGQGVLAIPELVDSFTPLAALQARWPDIVAERRTAARIWGFDSFKDDQAIDLLLVGSTRRPEAHEVPPLRLGVLPPKATTSVDGLRLTTPAWTLADLGAAPGVDADRVELAFESALHRRLTTEAKLHAAIERLRGPGVATLAAALARRRPGDPPTESYAETRFLQRIVRPLDLEDPARQVPVDVPRRRTTYRCDFLFTRRRRLDVEVDGRDSHDGDHDSIRDHHLEQLGLEVARFAAWRVERDRSDVCSRLLAEIDLIS